MFSLWVCSNAVKTATRHGVNMANGLFRISLHLVTPRNGYVRCDRIRFDAMSARSISHSSSVCFFFCWFQHLKRLWPLLAVLLLRFCMPKVLNQLEKGQFCTVLLATPLKRAHTRRASCDLCSLQQYCEAFFHALSILICST